MAALRALTAFHADGQFVADGAEVDSADPIVKGREHLFGPVAVAAAPKPKRGPGRPRKTAAADTAED